MSSMKVKIAALRALENKHGCLTPTHVVEAARNPKHPLHKDFEWDNTKAAANYRLDQARHLISSVRVVMTVEKQKFSVVGYVRDPDVAPLQGYRAIARIRSEESASADVLAAEVERVRSIFERAQNVAKALDLEDELQAALDATMVLLGRLQTMAQKEPPPRNAAVPPAAA
jgi:hypothetical protein